MKLTHWVLAFTEVIIGSAARAPSLISTSPVDNQDTLRADCPGTRSTVNVFPPTFLGRAPRAPPARKRPARSRFLRFDYGGKAAKAQVLSKFVPLQAALFCGAAKPPESRTVAFKFRRGFAGVEAAKTLIFKAACSKNLLLTNSPPLGNPAARAHPSFQALTFWGRRL